MKSMDIFCASPASTAICSSLDQRSMIRHGMRPLDRNSHDHPKTRSSSTLVPCSSSQLPFDPKNITTYYKKGRKSSAKPSDLRRKSSADITDHLAYSPPGSSRYLLSDTPFIDFLSSSDSSGKNDQALVPSQPLIRTKQRIISTDERLLFRSSSTRAQRSLESPVYKPSPAYSNDLNVYKSLSTRSCPQEKVVELRVSIHCKGCEGKIRKHISRMEGVKSFSIDLASKKVTVIGDVTPLGVLASISKVKSAQFWPSPTTSWSSSSSLSSSSSMISVIN